MRTLLFLLSLLCGAQAFAQKVYSLGSLQAMALRENHHLQAVALNKDVALNERKAARTKYLPKVEATAGYVRSQREISILSGSEKQAIGNMGALLGGGDAQRTAVMNALGEKIVDDFRTDSRNLYIGALTLTQPLYMGGQITALNNMAKIAQDIASSNEETQQETLLQAVNKAYWLVVSLGYKEKLAVSYLDLVSSHKTNVEKMISQGVATKADALRVGVKVNEGEIQLLKVRNALSLAKQCLAQLVGLPLEEDFTLEDERGDDFLDDAAPEMLSYDTNALLEQRSEMRTLRSTVDISRQAVKAQRSGYLPQVVLTGGYVVSNPNGFDSFRKTFSGMWSVGVMVRMPVWNWQETAYKVRAAKTATLMASLEMDEMREKMQLQVKQSEFQVKEALKRLGLAQKSVELADENLRCAELGFKDGVMLSTDVMEAQTAWNKAQSERIDAKIDCKTSNVNLKRALGVLQSE